MASTKLFVLTVGLIGLSLIMFATSTGTYHDDLSSKFICVTSLFKFDLNTNNDSPISYRYAFYV